MEGGRINIQYRRVECTPPEPLKVNIHANVGVGGWLRIAVEVRSIAADSLCEWPTLCSESKTSACCAGVVPRLMCCGAPWPDMLALRS